jgi:hypothetical protein
MKKVTLVEYCALKDEDYFLGISNENQTIVKLKAFPTSTSKETICDDGYQLVEVDNSIEFQRFLPDDKYNWGILPEQYIGNISCRFNASNPQLRCAVNPEGPCKGCQSYEKIPLIDSIRRRFKLYSLGRIIVFLFFSLVLLDISVSLVNKINIDINTRNSPHCENCRNE